MLILRRRYEFYFCLALSRIGAVYIPCTDQLKKMTSFIEPMHQVQDGCFADTDVAECVERSLMKALPLISLYGRRQQGWLALL